MVDLGYIEVPSSMNDDDNRDKSSWFDGRCVSVDLGDSLMLYLGHRTYVSNYINGDGSVSDKTVTEAFPVRVDKPVTRAKAIAAAEMAAYGLSSSLEVASLSASLSRKFRNNPEDKEIQKHDRFISWVKSELDNIGLRSDSVEDQVLLVSDLCKFVKFVINKADLSPSEALSMKGYYPEWKSGIDVEVGQYYRCDGKLYECDQKHTTQDNWRPGSQTSLWHEVVDGNTGTMDDPIPYNNEHAPGFEGMILENGKYYSQDDVLYKCVRDSVIPLTHDLKDLIGLYVELA